MPRIHYIALLIGFLIVPLLGSAQSSTNNPCNIGSQPGSEWPTDGVCYDFDKPASYTTLFNPGTCNAGAFADAWAWFVGDGGNMTITYQSPVGGDGVLHVFAAFSTCGVAQVGCSDVTGAGGAETVNLTPSIQGQIYFVRIQNWNANIAMMNGCLQISSTSSNPAVDYTHPTAGIANEFVGTCLESTCSGFYTDDGGINGNYSTGIPSIYRVFCPDSPLNCVSITFTYMDVENGFGCPFDYLTVGNGPTQNSPLFTTAPALASGRICGAPAVPFTYTSTHASGCLTLRFTSDGSVAAPGWAATISCNPCAGGPTGMTNADCWNATSICASTGNAGNSVGPGIQAEGCTGASCPAGGENHTNWYAFQILTSGTLAFNINPTVGTDDYDFALYGPNVGCGALGNPIRCSDAGTTGATGMQAPNVDLSEDVTGNGFVAPLNVTAGETYFLVVDEWSPTGAGYNLNFTGTATFDCTVLPIELSGFSAEYIRNEDVVDINWTTKSEMNSDYFVVERSTDGENFSGFIQVDAAGTSTNERIYLAIDNQPPAGYVYYRLAMVDQDGKRRYSDIKVVEVMEEENDLKVFPNPADKELELQFTCLGDRPLSVSIFDQAGRKLIEENVNCQNGYNESKIDVQDLIPGTYVVQVKMDDLIERRLIQITH